MRYHGHAGDFGGVCGSCVKVVAIQLKLMALDPLVLLVSGNMVEVYVFNCNNTCMV